MHGCTQPLPWPLSGVLRSTAINLVKQGYSWVIIPVTALERMDKRMGRSSHTFILLSLVEMTIVGSFYLILVSLRSLF